MSVGTQYVRETISNSDCYTLVKYFQSHHRSLRCVQCYQHGPVALTREPSVNHLKRANTKYLHLKVLQR